MFIKNIIRSIISILLPFAIILNCGCQNTEDSSQISDSGTSSATQENVTDSSDIVTTVSDNGDTVTTVSDNSDIVTTPAVTTEKHLEPIPDEWIYICSSFGVLTDFISTMNADCSEGEMRDIIQSLVNKNVLFSLTNWGFTFEIDWDNPITYGDDGLTLYPAVSVFFPDVKSIYELAVSVYGSPNDKVYTFDSSTNSLYQPDTKESRLFFTEIDGKMYVDPNCLVKKGAPEPFHQVSYIEITEQTEDMCKLTWHYPDWEGLREPDKYYVYFYEAHYKAIYSEGAWRLDRVIGL